MGERRETRFREKRNLVLLLGVLGFGIAGGIVDGGRIIRGGGAGGNLLINEGLGPFVEFIGPAGPEIIRSPDVQAQRGEAGTKPEQAGELAVGLAPGPDDLAGVDQDA